MDKEELQKLWEDPANWKPLCYNCAKDPRIIVPKRQKWRGWTINAAHKGLAAFMMIGGMVIVLAGPVVVIAAEGERLNQGHLLIGMAVSAVSLIGFCQYFSTRK